MKTGMFRHYRLLALGLAALLALVGLWWRGTRVSKPPAHFAYSASGFGGYVPATQPVAPSTDALDQAADAYNAGHYPQAESKAQEVLARTPRPALSRVGEKESQGDAYRRCEAGMILAFAAARRKDLSLARDRFAEVREEAAQLSDHGKPPDRLGENQATLEEQAAYQHAVCTGVLDGPREAEPEYRRFMCRYPESPLVHGAVKRIARFHGGDVPPDAEWVWKQAMKVAQARDRARQRERSLCGPACMAELLRRQGKRTNVHMLADEMQTSYEGTTLASLAETAKRRGFHPRGLALTEKGLAKQALPVVALVGQGHYVLIERVSPSGVQVWDPDGHGLGKAAARAYSASEWQRLWGGVTLALR